MRTGLRMGRVAGVELYVDWSVAIIFALVAFGLGGGVLPRWHPDWGGALRWGVAIAAAVAFFASILIHEMSHALVGRAFGMRIPRITLFVFGGMAHLQGEPATPKAELLMAGVGPLTSIALGVASSLVGVELIGEVGRALGSPEEVVRSAGPLATVLLWLGPINIMLGVFNLVPGFPLDGGRVLRAGVWWATGDLERATRWASGAGRLFGWTLMTFGVAMAFGLRVPIFGSGLGGGIWLVLIGWFLQSAARASYVDLRTRTRLAHVRVREFMRLGVDTVRPETRIDELVRDHVMTSDQTSFPVIDGTELVGVISTRAIQGIAHDRWPFVSVRDAMVPAASVPSIEVDAEATDALEALASEEVEQLPVVDHGRLRGFVRRQDILKWLALQPDVAR